MALSLIAGCSGTAPSVTPAGATISLATAEATATSSAAASSASASSAPTGFDPCSALTQAEVATATGYPVEAGGLAPEPTECGWAYQDPAKKSFVAVTLKIGVDVGAICAEASRPDMQQYITQVSGVGDVACFREDDLEHVIALYFEHGGKGISLRFMVAGDAVAHFTKSALMDVERTLALDALRVV
jgi:hypothetical protein